MSNHKKIEVKKTILMDSCGNLSDGGCIIDRFELNDEPIDDTDYLNWIADCIGKVCRIVNHKQVFCGTRYIGQYYN